MLRWTTAGEISHLFKCGDSRSSKSFFWFFCNTFHNFKLIESIEINPIVFEPWSCYWQPTAETLLLFTSVSHHHHHNISPYSNEAASGFDVLPPQHFINLRFFDLARLSIYEFLSWWELPFVVFCFRINNWTISPKHEENENSFTHHHHCAAWTCT